MAFFLNKPNFTMEDFWEIAHFKEFCVKNTKDVLNLRINDHFSTIEIKMSPDDLEIDVANYLKVAYY